MATEYTYLTDRQMQQVKHIPGEVELLHDCLGTRTLKKVKPIIHHGRAVYADKNGTLYDRATGECLSSRQMRIVLDAEAKVTRKRKDTAAREHEGWMNEARRAAA